MNKRLQELRDFTQQRGFRKYRSDAPSNRIAVFGSEQLCQTILFKARCEEEKPVVLKDERIAFMRTQTYLVQRVPAKRFSMEWAFNWMSNLPARIMADLHHRFPEYVPHRYVKSLIYNTTADYGRVLSDGLSARIELAKKGLNGACKRREREFLQCAIETMESLLELVGRYAEEAEHVGNKEIAAILRNVPANRPRSFHEALQMLRILNFSQYLAGMSHCGLGRMDQYLWAFYDKDISNNTISREEAGELLAEFFISLNRDSDLYPGVQQGDNGQSVMLGGCDPVTGEPAVNDLTYLILEVSRDVRLIDPKINLRVDKNTPLKLLELGSQLTACGLGFPQYSNDDVVVPALIKKGYALEDARDYSVAACWEFVIPGRAADYVNVGAVSFPAAVDKALRKQVAKGRFGESEFRRNIRHEIKTQLDRVLRWNDIKFIPHPYLSALFVGSLETKRDFTECAKYKFRGVHGAGGANAADAMAAISAIYAQDGMDGLKELVKAQDANFKGAERLRNWLVNEAPKVGASAIVADEALKFLFDAYADVASEYHGLRPGSGSAMFYVWLTDKDKRPKWLVEPLSGATSDGRMEDAPLGASLAPAHEAKVCGVMSVFKSFSVIDYLRIMNGGPVTIELSHSVFESPEGTTKLGQLIQYFVSLGGQQLQLNLLDVAELEDAMKHPEMHRNLIVRVWGWSGYFVELAPEYQRQIIKRHQYG